MTKIIRALINYIVEDEFKKIVCYTNYATLFILFILYLSGGISGSAVLLVTKKGLPIELGVALFLGAIFFIGLFIEMLLSKSKDKYGQSFYSLNNHSWVIFFFIFSQMSFWYVFQLNCDHLEFVSDSFNKIVYVSSEKNIEILHVIYKILITYFSINALFSPYLFYQVGQMK